MCNVRHADLAIQEGGEPERRKVREQLERYCGQDTEGMIWIVEALRKLTA